MNHHHKIRLLLNILNFNLLVIYSKHLYKINNLFILVHYKFYMNSDKRHNLIYQLCILFFHIFYKLIGRLDRLDFIWNHLMGHIMYLIKLCYFMDYMINNRFRWLLNKWHRSGDIFYILSRRRLMEFQSIQLYNLSNLNLMVQYMWYNYHDSCNIIYLHLFWISVIHILIQQRLHQYLHILILVSIYHF